MKLDDTIVDDIRALYKHCNHIESNGTNAETALFGQLIMCYRIQAGQDAVSGLLALLDAKWIQAEAKVDILAPSWAQVRIYVLPDDVGRSIIDRQSAALRAHLQCLLAKLDVSKMTWTGSWDPTTPIKHVDPGTEGDLDNTTLFQLFNTLPSPEPNPDFVQDPYGQIAMDQILSGEVEGLKTDLHFYQRRSAALMVQRETQPAQVLDPRLKVVNDAIGGQWYLDPAAGTCLREARKYDGTRGGICAETVSSILDSPLSSCCSLATCMLLCVLLKG